MRRLRFLIALLIKLTGTIPGGRGRPDTPVDPDAAGWSTKSTPATARATAAGSVRSPHSISSVSSPAYGANMRSFFFDGRSRIRVW
jgi:hypothetical protein